MEGPAAAAKRPRVEANGAASGRAAGPGPGSLACVCKVFTSRAEPHFAMPWQMRPQRQATGSAFVLSASLRRIATNHHVVAFSTSLYVRRPGNPKKFRAKVLCAAAVCDLAIVTVDDDAFWEGMGEVTLVADVPLVQSEVYIAGFPMGDSLGITKGIVSRITTARYSASQRLLSVQIDAAINGGNSGGPAFDANGEVVGVAFAKNASSRVDNIGYLIPVQLLHYVLQDFDGFGRFRGVPGLGFNHQTLENENFRAFLRLRSSGVYVSKVDRFTPAGRVLQEGDTILEVDGERVADDGTFSFRGDERLGFLWLLRRLHVGAEVTVLILRAGEELRVSWTLEERRVLVPSLPLVENEAWPAYFTVGGLVFAPLSMPFLVHAYGNDWRKACPVRLQDRLSAFREHEHEQVVVLFQVLRAELNHGYTFTSLELEKFNGNEVVTLAGLAAAVDLCLAGEEPYLNFHFIGGTRVVLSRAECLASSQAIMEQHGISKDRLNLDKFPAE